MGHEKLSIVTDGQRYGMSLSRVKKEAFEIFAALAKENRGVWIPEGKIWIFEEEGAKAVIDRLAAMKEPVVPREEIRQVLREAMRSRDPYALARYLNVRICRTKDAQTVLTCHYDRILVKTIRGAKGNFVKTSKVWLVPMPPEALVKVLEEKGGVNADNVLLLDVVVDFEEFSKSKGTSIDVFFGESKTIENPGGPAGEKPKTMTAFGTPLQILPVNEDALRKEAVQSELLPHQVEGVRHLLQRTSALLADDMGLGKTRQAVVAAKLAGGRTLIVPPATLRSNWKNEIMAIGIPEETIFVVSGGKAVPPITARWVICNYENVETVLRSNQRFETIVVDEAHFIKESGSKRTQATMMLASKIPRRYILTATPVLNRESEIHSLLRLGGHPVGLMPVEEFSKIFARSREARLDLNHRISEWMLRRMKTEVVSLPGKERTIVKLDPPKAFVREFSEIVNNEGLMAIQKFVQMITVSERHKITFVVDALQSMGEKDKAIVFCNRLESVNTIVREMENAGIGCVRYTGKEVENRDEAVRLFQKDPDTRVFVSTFGAGGVGITLTSGNIVIHAGLPMTPAHLDQAEDRANRIGQKRRVRVLVPALKGSIDEGLLDLLDEKRERIGEVMGEKEWEGAVRQFVQATVRNRTKSGEGEKTG